MKIENNDDDRGMEKHEFYSPIVFTNAFMIYFIIWVQLDILCIRSLDHEEGHMVSERILVQSMMSYVDMYTEKQSMPLDQIRTKLLSYQGGCIECTKDDSTGIASIRINHPEKKNAISGKMMVDLENVVNDLQNWNSGKGIVLFGADGIFCSGGDLEMAKKGNNPTFGYEMSIFMKEVLNRFLHLPLISVAFINGHGAIGGGAEITTACDYRVFDNDPKTYIGFVHCKMGIVPAWGGTGRLVDIVGKRAALDILCSGSLLPYDEASKIGLIDGMVNGYEGAYEWIKYKTRHDGSVTRAIKATIVNLEDESRIFAPLWGGKANKEALKRNIKHKVND